MADNVAITAGSGTTVGTDEVTISATAVQVQYVKVLDATANGTNALVVDSSGRVTAIIVNPSGTATQSGVSLSASSFTIITSNSARKGLFLFNDSGNILYVKLDGGTATTTNYSFQLPAGGYWEMPGSAVFTNTIVGIATVATGIVKVTEVA